MAAKASAWPTFFYFSRTAICEVTRQLRNVPLGSSGSKKFTDSKSKMALLASDWPRHNIIFLKLLHIKSLDWPKCSSVGYEEMLFFGVLWNRRWLSWPMNGTNFSRKTACNVTSHSKSVPLLDPMSFNPPHLLTDPPPQMYWYAHSLMIPLILILVI